MKSFALVSFFAVACSAFNPSPQAGSIKVPHMVAQPNDLTIPSPQTEEQVKELIILQGSIDTDAKEKLQQWQAKYHAILEGLPKGFSDPNVSLLGYWSEKIDAMLDDLNKPANEQAYNIQFSPDVPDRLQLGISIMAGMIA